MFFKNPAFNASALAHRDRVAVASPTAKAKVSAEPVRTLTTTDPAAHAFLAASQLEAKLLKDHQVKKISDLPKDKQAQIFKLFQTVSRGKTAELKATEVHEKVQAQQKKLEQYAEKIKDEAEAQRLVEALKVFG